jgi:hypothetical protein
MEPASEELDLAERGARGQRSDRRLFMQLLAFGGCRDVQPLIAALKKRDITGVLYGDVNDPTGVALVTMSEDPGFFTGRLRESLLQPAFASLTLKPHYTMFGRTYSLGYEPDLEDTLLHRPQRTALNPEWPWAVWYPLRRSGAFSRLTADQQRDILKEHGTIGFAFGRGDYAHDIRLASHGLDTHDNDFTVGLMGRELAPLSILVQTMRKTQQTSLYLERLGPFFVGRAVWQAGRGDTVGQG